MGTWSAPRASTARARRQAELIHAVASGFYFVGRGERIRTSDILLPKQARYQTALRPVSF
jgi:hypothetical protein